MVNGRLQFACACLGAIALACGCEKPPADEQGGEIPHVSTAEQFRAEVLGHDGPVLVDVYAVWCGPCKLLAPTIVALARDYSGMLKVVEVDGDRSPEIMETLRIEAYPTVILFDGGRELKRWVGLERESVYRAAIEQAVKANNKEQSMSKPKTTVTMRGKPVELIGAPPRAGEKAPAFTAVANDMSSVNFPADFSGKVTVIAAVPSLDTPVCDREGRRFNQEASDIGPDVRILVVSMDLPFAQQRWCGSAGIKNIQTVSDYRGGSFGRAYGVLMKDVNLLARSVFVVDRSGRVAYAQLVAEVADEPDYDAALAAARSAAAG